MAATPVNVTDYRTIPGKLLDDGITWQFPTVESINAHSRDTFWRISVRLVDGDGKPQKIKDEYFNNVPIFNGWCGYITVDSGVANGKIKDAKPTLVRTGKNLGKASATNVWTQALRDALGMYNKQSKKAIGRGARSILYPPMLAQIYKDDLVHDGDSLLVQRKYNGVRAVATLVDGEVIMYSRRGNIYPAFSYIKAELKPALVDYWGRDHNVYLDGEIYKHGESLQEISGTSRREHQPTDKHYDYMIYDCFVPNDATMLASTRQDIIECIFDDFVFVYAKRVETFTVYTRADVHSLYERFLKEGYEGAMVRLEKPYKYSVNEYHSRDLLKLKPTFDAEWPISGYTTGEKGKAAAALMIVCRDVGGKEFPVTPAMELVERISLARKMSEVEPNGRTHFQNHWEGRKLIVYYDELSKDGIPQRARTRMEIRNWD